jgi:hypothetical protein
VLALSFGVLAREAGFSALGAIVMSLRRRRLVARLSTSASATDLGTG